MFETERIAASDFRSHGLLDYARPPFRRFEISTPMSTSRAAQVLGEIVEPPRKWGQRTSAKRGFFEGKVVGTRFKFHRVIRGQNSFTPIIEGDIRRSGFGSAMIVNMRLIWPVMVFWIGVVIFLLWNSIEVESNLAGPFRVRVAVAAMALFMYLLATVCFTIEARIATKRLLETMLPSSAV
jgi:hypothetical protein